MVKYNQNESFGFDYLQRKGEICMKKKIVALSVVMLIAVVLSSLLMLLPSAEEPKAEAQLVTTPTGGTATTESGTLDEIIAKLNGAMSPVVETDYQVKLLSDATQSVPAILEGNGKETVTVMLDGFTLTSATASDLYTVSGLADFKLVGGFTNEAVLGRLVSDRIAGAIVAIPEDSAAKAEISDVEIEYSGLNPDGAVLDVASGSLKLRNAAVKYTGEKNALGAADELSLIKVKNASLTLTLSDVLDAAESGVISAISADAATVRIERGRIDAEYALRLSGATFANLIDPDITAAVAVLTAPSGDVDNVVNTAGVKINAPHIISGGVGKEDVTLWYGSGGTYIVGVNPTDEATLATSETSVKALGSAYTLAHSFTGLAILTTMPDHATPTEVQLTGFKTGTFASAAPTVPTAYIMTLLKDMTYTGSYASMTNGHENSTVFLDYNGKNIDYTTKNSNIMTTSGAYRFYIDGADAEGNRATVTSNRTAGAILYDKSGTQDAVFIISECDIVFEDDTSKSPVLQLCGGFAYIFNNTFTYTGAAVTTAPTSATYIPFVTAQSTSKPFVYDCEFNQTETMENLYTSALNMSSTAKGYGYAKNVKINTTRAVNISATTAGVRFCLADSEVTTAIKPYSASSPNSPLYISDTITHSPVSEVASGYTYFLMGDGKNRVITATGEISGGKFLEGFSFCPTSEENEFMVASNNIALHPMFTNGMVLQAGKPTNVYGTSLAEGSTVTVKVGELASATAVVTDGKWCATLDNLPYAQDVDIVVSDDSGGSSPTTIQHVDIGEIWVMSGQSNSVYDVTNMDDFDEYLELADDYKIKAYIMPQSSSMVEKTVTSATWHTIDKAWLAAQAPRSNSSKHSVGLSAVAYVMATRLAVELPKDTTVAVIDANFNGSGVQTWMDYDVAKTYAPTYAETYKAYYDAYIENGNVYPTEDQMKAKGITSYIASNKIYSSMPSACYNAMIAPMEGFTVRGTVWYQGEGNGGSVTATSDGNYTARWRAVRESFRKTFGNDSELPMFVIQIPPYFATLAEFKALQYKMVGEDENCYVVSNSMEGPVFSTDDLYTSSMSDNMVHYARKSPMGVALAASILENIYGKGELSMPKIVDTIVDGSVVKLTLDRDFEIAWGDEILGFELAGPNGEFKTAKATASGRTITLAAPGVIVPKAVRYGYGLASIEFEDGNTIELDKNVYTFTAAAITGQNDKHGKTIYNVTITEKETGEVLYSFTSDDTPIVRCRGTGNLVATNGQTLPVFKITLG